MLLPVLLLALIQAPLPDADRSERLYVDCKNAIKIMDSGNGPTVSLGRSSTCMDYINGLLDGVNISAKRVCLNDHTSLLTLARVYVAYMDKNPKLMGEFKAFTLMAALLDAYPC